ncbi:hypothetical protein IW261DRAFT_1562623 [Armillaria novae-zelandiae]|uniref:Uncharacterized protein n=1 Tax=Armillaria novae-zelandiae TaxID=153914 RepID=A0AA39PBV8_9AGAR|nr:hypothetical protein IW261DRAFT_1562623 [Armillaria novae-zelandiae]
MSTQNKHTGILTCHQSLAADAHANAGTMNSRSHPPTGRSSSAAAMPGSATTKKGPMKKIVKAGQRTIAPAPIQRSPTPPTVGRGSKAQTMGQISPLSNPGHETVMLNTKGNTDHEKNEGESAILMPSMPATKVDPQEGEVPPSVNNEEDSEVNDPLPKTYKSDQEGGTECGETTDLTEDHGDAREDTFPQMDNEPARLQKRKSESEVDVAEDRYIPGVNSFAPLVEGAAPPTKKTKKGVESTNDKGMQAHTVNDNTLIHRLRVHA